MPPALELQSVARSFRAGLPGCFASARVLERVALRVDCGEIVGVVGDEGAGKTTLLLCAAGLLRPDRGRVSWFGVNAASDDRGAAGVRFVPAWPRFPHRSTVRELLGDAARGSCDQDPRSARAPHQLRLAGISDVPTAMLPGDALRRVALARAIASGARLLLLDEPLFALGDRAVADVAAVVHDFVEAGGAALLTGAADAPVGVVASRLLTLRAGVLCDGADGRAADGAIAPRDAVGARAPRRRVAEHAAEHVAGKRSER